MYYDFEIIILFIMKFDTLKFFLNIASYNYKNGDYF